MSSWSARTRSWRTRWRGETAELVAAKERLESQSARLRRANAFKGEVLGTVAHDLKNPLGVILGRTEDADRVSFDDARCPRRMHGRRSTTSGNRRAG
jgi:signal transduction histidine kinase